MITRACSSSQRCHSRRLRGSHDVGSESPWSRFLRTSSVHNCMRCGRSRLNAHALPVRHRRVAQFPCVYGAHAHLSLKRIYICPAASDSLYYRPNARDWPDFRYGALKLDRLGCTCHFCCRSVLPLLGRIRRAKRISWRNKPKKQQL